MIKLAVRYSEALKIQIVRELETGKVNIDQIRWKYGIGGVLEQALADLPRGCQPIHHSARGTQYCCHEYVDRLPAHSLSISMTERTHCAENAMAERLNGILKSEFGWASNLNAKRTRD